MLRGGLDPVALRALPGDSVDIEIQSDDNVRVRYFFIRVPRARRPVVVRTEPPRGKRDVPLYSVVTVIFSEPMDSTSLAQGGMTLSSGLARVAGRLDFADPARLVARFTPSEPLAPGSDYDILLGAPGQDMDGATLEQSTVIPFTTVTPTPASLLPGRLLGSTWGAGGMPSIHTMRPDGTDIVTLVPGVDPVWSPDGTRIAFWRSAPGGGAIFVMNADGTGVRQVAAPGYQPAWSPDGQQIAFGCGGICTVSAAGGNVTVLTEHALPVFPPEANNMCLLDSDPSWSASGIIAFTRWNHGATLHHPWGIRCTALQVALSFPFDFITSIWTMNGNGSSAKPLLEGEWHGAYWPSWSPDGSKLAFYQFNLSLSSIDVVSEGGSDRKTIMRVTAWPDIYGRPAWSPDARTIAVGAWYGGHMFLANAEGTGEYITVVPPAGKCCWSGWSWGAPR